MRPGARVWVSRAEPGASETAERLAALGFSPVVAPVLAVRALDAPFEPEGADALAFTSRNGVRRFAERSTRRALPVFAVGDATAAAAQAAGFADVRSAGGDLAALADLIRAQGGGRTILHPCALQPAGDLAALVGDAAAVIALPVYEAVETSAPPPEGWDAVLIQSPRAGRALAALLSPEATRDRIALAISSAAAAPLSRLAFAEVRVAPTPDEAALLVTLGKPEPSV